MPGTSTIAHRQGLEQFQPDCAIDAGCLAHGTALRLLAVAPLRRVAAPCSAGNSPRPRAASQAETALVALTHQWRSFASMALIAAGASLCMAAMAVDANTLKEIEARYQEERAACESGRTGQDRETCLEEAIRARAAAQQGQLDDAPGVYEKNAVARCDALPAEERDLCRRRARGEGENTGSVEGGGILREYREVTLPSVTPQPPQAPQSQQAPQRAPQTPAAPQNGAVNQYGK